MLCCGDEYGTILDLLHYPNTHSPPWHLCSPPVSIKTGCLDNGHPMESDPCDPPASPRCHCRQMEQSGTGTHTEFVGIQVSPP